MSRSEDLFRQVAPLCPIRIYAGASEIVNDTEGNPHDDMHVSSNQHVLDGGITTCRATTAAQLWKQAHEFTISPLTSGCCQNSMKQTVTASYQEGEKVTKNDYHHHYVLNVWLFLRPKLTEIECAFLSEKELEP